jgi:transcription termination factor NusB
MKQKLTQIEFFRDQVWSIIKHHAQDIRSILGKDFSTLSFYELLVVRLILYTALAELHYGDSSVAVLLEGNKDDSSGNGNTYC